MTESEIGGALPIVEDIDGTRFDDPFRRLEDNGPEVHAWQRELDEEARRYLHRRPGFDDLVAQVERHLGACRDDAPARCGDVWIRCVRDDVDGGQALWLSATPAGTGRRLIGPADLLVAAHPVFEWVLPSPSGRWIALGVASNGSETPALHFVDALSGEVGRMRIADVSGDAVAWLPEGDALCCVAGATPFNGAGTSELLIVEPDGRAAQCPLPQAGSDAVFGVQLSGCGRYLGLTRTGAAPRLIHVLDRVSERWIAVAPVDDQHTFSGVFVEDRYYAVTTTDAPRGRLVAAEVSRLADADALEELRGEDDQAVLRAIGVLGSTLVLHYLAEGASRLQLLSTAGHDMGRVPLPGTGVVTTSPRDPMVGGTSAPVHVDDGGLTFSFTTFNRSPALMRYERATGRTRVLRRSEIELRDLEMESVACPVPGGGSVKYDIVGNAASPVSSGRPTLIVAYGGWNAVSAAKSYIGPFAPFAEAGGNVVFAHVRGDGTYGETQWRNGRREYKQQSFDDLFLVAQDLLRRGVAAHGELGLWGMSNGGLLVGAAITQRPELFRVAIAVVPLFDMCRFVRDHFGERLTSEYGDPRLPEAAAWLRRYSPYHNVTTGTAYPATLIVCADRDARTPPWHARKMAAALRNANGGDRPILLRTHAACGHLGASDFASPRMVAEWLAFAMDRLGLGRHDTLGPAQPPTRGAA
jgi:prolyl oligopeptidase